MFQMGDSMGRYELPENTRVIYPGVRRDGETKVNKVLLVKNAILPFKVYFS